MSRITPGDKITHTDAQIAELVGQNLQPFQDDLASVSSDLHVVSVNVGNISTDLDDTKSDLNNTKTNLATTISDLQTTNTNLNNTQNDLSSTQDDLNNTKDGLTATQNDLNNTKLDLVALRDDVTNLPVGTTVVTSLPTDPSEVDGTFVVFLDVVDTDDRGLYTWDGMAWVSPSKLLDGSVTAEKLDSGIIFSAEIEAGEIKETHIADDSISTPKIRAGAVTTSKLVVGNFANLCENNDFELGDTSWDKGQGWTIVNDPTNSYNGSYCAKKAGFAIGTILNNVKFKCVPNQKYIAQANIKLGAGANGYGAVRVVTFDSSGAQTVVGTGSSVISSTYSMSEVTVTVPSNAVNIRVEVIATNTTGYIYVDQGVLSINSLTVIEDGSITTDKLAANSVTVNKIAAGAVTAEKMTVTSLSAITANMGELTSGIITLDSAGHIKGGQTAYNSGTGFFLGYNAGYYKMSFGSASQGFTWDGTNFTIKGGSININNLFTTDSAGNVSIRSAAAGARLEIKNNVIKVYDASNVLRVQIGDLTA